jgi:phosphopantetheine adenylyltransferase
MIPSPFYKNTDQMFQEIHEVLNKYGYKEVAVVYTEVVDNEHSMYHAASSHISEGLIEYLRTVADDMEENYGL